MLKSRGQASFEIVMIMAVIVSVSALIIANYVQVNHTTLGLAIAKPSITEKILQLSSPYTIDTLEGVSCGTELNLAVSTIPNDLTTANFIAYGFITDIQTDIVNSTSFTSIDLVVNLPLPAC